MKALLESVVERGSGVLASRQARRAFYWTDETLGTRKACDAALTSVILESGAKLPNGRVEVLTKVTIGGYRSMEDLTLDALGPTLVLVGRNGAGKTNILKAIYGAARGAIRISTVLQRPRFEGGDTIALEFQMRLSSYRYSFSMTDVDDRRIELQDPRVSWIRLDEEISVADLSGDWENLARREGSEVRIRDREPFQTADAYMPLLSLVESHLSPGDPDLSHFSNVREFLNGVHYYPLDETSEPRTESLLSSTMFDVIPVESYRTWVEQRGRNADLSDSVRMILLDLMLASPDVFSEINSLLGDDGLGLIDRIDIQSQEHPLTPGGRPHQIILHMLSFLLKRSAGGTRSFSWSALSLGTRRIIRMIVAMLYDKSSVMLIEHPEDGIHRGMLAKVFDILRGYTDPMQIIVSSHSAKVFNLVEPEEIRLVTMEHGVTRAHRLSDGEAEGARRYIDEAGTLDEYLRFTLDA